MPIPLPPLSTKTISIAGTDVTIRSLSRTEVLKLNDFAAGDEEAAEVLLVSKAMGVSDEEALAWLTEVDPIVADDVLEEIIQLSGVAELRRRQASKDQEAKGDPKASTSRRRTSGPS